MKLRELGFLNLCTGHTMTVIFRITHDFSIIFKRIHGKYTYSAFNSFYDSTNVLILMAIILSRPILFASIFLLFALFQVDFFLSKRSCTPHSNIKLELHIWSCLSAYLLNSVNNICQQPPVVSRASI